MKKLPDAEFEIMKAIWHIEQPVTSPALTVVLSRDLPDRDWKQQTVMTMLGRLEKKGFLRSEKNGNFCDRSACLLQDTGYSVLPKRISRSQPCCDRSSRSREP